jgi:predicted phage terminase large subunit-like protein
MNALISPAITANRALWEEFFPLAKMEELRREMGTLIFNLQFMNDARLSEGVVFRPEWIRRHAGAPKEGENFTGVDLAVSEKPGADFFAAVTVRLAGGNFYVLDAVRDRCSFLTQAKHVRKIAAEFKPKKIGIESVAYQAAFASYLAETTDLPVVEVRPRGDKVARAYRLSALCEAGRLFLGENHGALEKELLDFPDGAHDDLLDALEIAVSVAGRPFRQVCARIAGI